jgi:hypothetical protein
MKASVFKQQLPSNKPTQTQNESKLEIIKTMNTTNSTSSDSAALIGIDWASQRHALCLYDCATGKRESSTSRAHP